MSLDDYLKYSKRFDVQQFIILFFQKDKILNNDHQIIDKINLLRYDFASFWLSLDNTQKQLF